MMSEQKLMPQDVTGSRVVREALSLWMKKHGISKLSDSCFNAFDSGFVLASCHLGTLEKLDSLLKGKKVMKKPLRMEATCAAFAQLREYSLKKGNLTEQSKELFVDGYLTAYYAFLN